jgi:quercetin dioxygenase-like cupin family protein
MADNDKCAENMLSDLLSAIGIKFNGHLRKGNQILALPTAFGTKRRIHGCTNNLMMISYEWERGGKMAPHDHEVEQISYVVYGKLRVTIGDQTFIAEKGDSYTEPKWTMHDMEALEPSLTIEVFSPPRPVFAVLEMAAYHNLAGAYEGIKKGMKASRKKKKS